MAEKHDALINTLNILAESNEVTMFEKLTENPQKTDVGEVKIRRLFELAPVKSVEEICDAKGIGETIMENMAQGLATNLGSAGVEIGKPLTKDVLVNVVDSLGSDNEISFELIVQPLIPAALASTTIIPASTLPLFATILNPMGFDEWLEIYDCVRKKGSKLIKDDLSTAWTNNARQGCALAVKCRTSVKLVKNLKQRATTQYVPKAVVDYGTWSGFDGTGGCYVTITLNFEINIRLDAIGKKYVEENKKVKAQLQKAGKPFSFARLPLEFLLIHEMLHRDDACRDLAAVAGKYLKCEMNATDKKSLQDDLEKQWKKITDAGAKGGKNGAVEEDIRRRGWEAWEKQSSRPR